MAKNHDLSDATNNRIVALIRAIERDAYTGKWRKDVLQFDAEQAAKDQKKAVEQANKAIKDRRGMK